MSTAQAGISTLAKEFLIQNSTVTKNNWLASSTKLKYDGLMARQTWLLEGSAVYDKNKLAGVGNDLFDTIITEQYSIAASKQFTFGGALKFENILQDNDRLRTLTQAEIFGTQEKFYEFQHVLSYKQDLGKNFFGREFKAELTIARLQEKEQEAAVKKVNQDLLIDFYSKYLEAKLNKSLIKLQTDALQRALTRRKLVASWVKDGLREKVDLFRTEILVRSQKENLNKAKADYQASLGELSKRLHRVVRENEIEGFDFSRPYKAPQIAGSVDQNLEVAAFEKSIAVIQENLRKLKFGYTPTISFQMAYKTNARDNRYTRAMNDGKLGSSQNEKTFSLNISFPWGFEPTKVQRAQSKIELLTKEMEKRKLQQSLLAYNKNLKSQIDSLENNMSLSRERRGFARKSLDDTNRLYKLGRANLDTVILSEEELIKTEISAISYQTNLEGVLALRASLYGGLQRFLTNHGG